MDLREAANRRPILTGILASLGIAVLLGVGVARFRAGRTPTMHLPNRSFYTADDGATLFVDDVNKVVPFDHDGKEAVLAFVFTADGGGHQWVQYLQKYSPEAKAQVEMLQSSSDSVGMKTNVLKEGLLVKRPGAGDWIKMIDAKSRAIVTPVPPDGMGSDLPAQVWP